MVVLVFIINVSTYGSCCCRHGTLGVLYCEGQLLYIFIGRMRHQAQHVLGVRYTIKQKQKPADCF